MIDFLKKNWKVILIGILGITAGFLLNIYANKQSEKRIIEALIAEIDALKEKQKTSRITSAEQLRLFELEQQLKALTL